jgi:two-component system sensor histidine kinase TctE
VEILESDPYDKVYYKVTGSDGFVSGMRELPAPKEAIGPGEIVYYDSTVRGEPVRLASYSIGGDGGGFEVTVAETLVKRQRLARKILLAVILPQIVLILLAGTLVWYGVSRGLVPLNMLTQAIQRRSDRDLSPLSDDATPAEVRPLTHAINDLLLRLGQALDAQQRFIADAAHQLRTPLSGLNAQIERALHETDIESMRPALLQLQLSSKRAARLVNQLLTLARAEPGADARQHFVRLDLAALTRETCVEWVPRALTRDIDLGYAGSDDAVFVEGDAVLLGEMLGNLIDNAIRYGSDHGAITVRLETAPAIVLAVEDDGPGISAEYAEHVFERFHRVPGTAGEGCGLGLAIVREIAQLHGARVSVAPRQPHGVRVEIDFGAVHSASQPARAYAAGGS